MKRPLAAILLAILLAAATLLLLRPGSSYAAQDREATLSASTPQHPAGTDQLGRDRSTRVAAALLLGLCGAALAAAVTTLIAAGIGTAAAFTPPPIAAGLLLLSDLFLTLPWLFLLMMVRSGLPLTTSPLHSAAITFIILAALGWPAFARAVHRGALNLKTSAWMIHGRATGLRPRQLVLRHLLPHLRTLLLPQFLVCVPAFIVAEANLGTLGLGIAEPLPSWGAMLLELGNSALLARSHWVYLPIALLITVLLIFDLLAADA